MNILTHPFKRKKILTYSHAINYCLANTMQMQVLNVWLLSIQKHSCFTMKLTSGAFSRQGPFSFQYGGYGWE